MTTQEWLNIVDGFKFRSDGDARMMFEGAEIIRGLLAEVEKYERKHSEMVEGSGCPPDGDCGGDDWTCKKCWAKYWEED